MLRAVDLFQYVSPQRHGVHSGNSGKMQRKGAKQQRRKAAEHLNTGFSQRFFEGLGRLGKYI
jgi:hypothetical protein